MSVIGAIMVPHPPIIMAEVGRGQEKIIQSTIDAYEKAARFAASLNPDTIVIATPHAGHYYDFFEFSGGSAVTGSMARFQAPNVSFTERYDESFVDSIAAAANSSGFPAGTLANRSTALDHGTMVPLYFIEKAYAELNIEKRFLLVRVGISDLPLEDHHRLGTMISRVSDQLGRRIVFVASGDLSHHYSNESPYGFSAEGPAYDERIMDVMGRAAWNELFEFDDDFLQKAGECGHRPFVMMAGALAGLPLISHRLSHEGPFGVGYGICIYEIAGAGAGIKSCAAAADSAGSANCGKDAVDCSAGSMNSAAEDEYVRLARQAIKTFVVSRKRLEVPGGMPDEMINEVAGTFVSIHEFGQLRGCVGTVSAVQSCIAEEIIANAISACSEDPRFNPISAAELDNLEITVDILSDPEDISSMEELNPSTYGVIVSKGYRRGLLLPNLDGIEKVEQQVSIAKRKAGIREGESGVKMQRFKVVRHY